MSPFMYTFLTIMVCAILTFATRAVPFVLFGRGDEPPEIVKYLGKMLPPAVMSVLIIYCVRNVDITSWQQVLPQVISIALVVVLHIWRRNNLLSIGGGTLCYMLLIQVIFK